MSLRTSILLFLFAARLDAAPPTFTPNNLFVTDFDNDRVVEFDPSGAFVRDFGDIGLDDPEGCAFGPDGLLWVASYTGDTIIAFDPSGAAVDTIDIPQIDGPNGLAFGPDGHLFVSCHDGDDVVELDGGGAFVRSFTGGGTLNGPDQIVFAPDGHLLVANSIMNRVQELDPSGVSIRALGVGDLTGPVGVCFGPSGFLWVASSGSDGVVGFIAGQALASFTDLELDGPRHVVGGPDFTMYVTSASTDRVVSFLGVQKRREVGATAGLSGPGGLAFAPFRMKVRVRGKLSGGSELVPFDQKAFVWIAPGSNTLMLRFIDDGVNRYADVFGSDTAVFHGLEGVTAQSQKHRLYQGEELRSDAVSSGAGSLALRVDGEVAGDEQYFTPRKIRGRLTRALGYAQLLATVSSRK